MYFLILYSASTVYLLKFASWTSALFWILFLMVPLEKALAPHSSTLAWKLPWTEEPSGLQSMGSRGVGHDWATSLSLFTFMHWRRKWQPTPVFLPGESQGRGSLMGAVYGVAQSRTRLKQFSSSYEITCGQVFFPAPQALWVFRGHQHWLWSCCYGKWPAAAFFPAQLWLLRQSKPVRKPFWIVTQRRTFQKKHLPSYLLSPGRIPGPSTLFCGRWCNS